ncbi:ATP-binding protein [Jatrophihabitans sp. YIM 134969]
MSLAVDGLELALRSMPGVTVGMLDANGRLVDAAGHWIRRTGMAPEDLLGRSVAEIAGHELAERCLPAVEAALGGSTTQLRVRNPLQAVDPGAPGWIEITMQPATPVDGEPRVFWLLRDVTGEHDLGDALTAAEQRLDLVGEGAREYAMFALDVHGVVTVWSAAAERLLGHPSASVVGRHFSVVFPADTAERGLVHALLRETLTSGTHREEVWLVDDDSRRVRCQLSLRALRDRQDEHIGFACIVRDLTEERRAQAAIALREQMYSAAFDDAPSAMALVEHHVGGWWRVVEANTALASLVGHSASALVGGAAPLLGDVGDGVVRDVFDAASASPGGRRELALIRADGTRRSVVVGLSPLVVPGVEPEESRRYVAQLHDVTARREAERAVADALASERRAGAELRELQRQRSDFLATVSHELRTPLASVLGYVELFTEGDLGDLAPVQRRALATIARNAGRLRDLVGDLLVMSSIERGVLRVDGCPVEVDSTLAAAVEGVRADADARDIAVVTSGAAGALVEMDASLLGRVLHALLTNAVKFTGAGGHVEVDVAGTDDTVAISVTDDGVGITAADLPRVFDPFFRAAASERLAVSGTGLGLSLVRKVVEMAGGTVTAESEPGVRTCFTVTLPARVEAAAAAGAA